MKKAKHIVDRLIEGIIIILVVSMVGANFWQIFTRFVLGHAANWTEEFMRYALIWLTMLGVPYAYGRDQHIAIEFLVNTFSRLGQMRDQLFIECVILILSLTVMVGGGSMVTLNARGQISAALHMPMEFYYLGIPICGVLMVFYTLPRIIRVIQSIQNEKRLAKEVK